jgi:acetyl esterase/lipase
MGRRFVLAAHLLLLVCSSAFGQEEKSSLPRAVQLDANLVYRRVEGHDLALDLYWRDGAERPAPLIIWVHGGGWRQGNRKGAGGILPLLDDGFAIATISYRLSGQAIFPAQIQDCKAAVRWLRAHADKFSLDPNHFGAWGGSAGGHLVALLGTAGNVKSWDVGEYLEYSSRVQAVCDWYGPTDFLRMDDVPGTMNHSAPDSPESQLIGGPIQENPEKVMRANPITYVTPDDPPFLIMHGQEDRTVIPLQSDLLHAALVAASVDSTLLLIPGTGHGFRGKRQELLQQPRDFFRKHLIDY